MAEQKTLGLALGAGGAKGLAHIGILKALHAQNIKPDYLAGTSMGAVIGAAYAAGCSPQELEEIAATTDWKKIVDFTLPKSGLLEPELIERKIAKLVRHKEFDELKIPLRVVGYNLSAKKRVIFSKGNVAKAVRASLSMPGIFPPLKIGKEFYIDGAVADPTPFDIVKQMGADVIVAVDLYHKEKTVSTSAAKTSFFEEMRKKFVIVELLNVKNYVFPERWPALLRKLGIWLFDKIIYPARVLRIIARKELPHITRVMYETVGILTNNLAQERMRHAEIDIIVSPSFHGLGWSDFDKGQEIIRIGEKAMEREMKKLKRKLH